MNPYASPAEVPTPDYSRSKNADEVGMACFAVGMFIGLFIGWAACGITEAEKQRWADANELRYRQTDVTGPLHEIIEKRREKRNHDVEPVTPVKPDEAKPEQKPKPRPFLHWLGRMGKNAADIFALPTKMELHAVLIALLTLLTVVVGMTFGFLKARYCYLAKVGKARK